MGTNDSAPRARTAAQRALAQRDRRGDAGAARRAGLPGADDRGGRGARRSRQADDLPVVAVTGRTRPRGVPRWLGRDSTAAGERVDSGRGAGVARLARRGPRAADRRSCARRARRRPSPRPRAGRALPRRRRAGPPPCHARRPRAGPCPWATFARTPISSSRSTRCTARSSTGCS